MTRYFKVQDIDISYKAVLQKLVAHYLSQIKVDKETLATLVKLHEQTILNDILPQIRDKLHEDTKIGYPLKAGHRYTTMVSGL